MEPALNCSALHQCHLHPRLDKLETVGILQDLCRASRAPDVALISVAVQGVFGSLLTCGLFLSIFFFIFTIRFRKNRIVKMSSPNLNLVIVLGSVFSYISAFMFAAQGHTVSMETIIQARVSLLYIGLSLVFGPLLGKSWRLYRVFTHRVPDKRVIIKDITLLGLEAALLFMDSLLLLSWVLSDPVTCVQNVSASIKAAERATFCEVTRTHLCSSKYMDFWIALLLGFKGMFLVYGTYLAGLTKNISTPPVNQSLAIMVGSSLVIVATVTVLSVSRFFYNWSSLVYGVTAGSVLLCTTTITCLIFIPQLLQWKQFEEEPSQTNVQMAKYFNSPCKSIRSMYSEEQIYHLLGENTSMRRLLTEKNAVIESLQEQVINAKEKLVELLKSECSVEITQVSAISTSTLTINQHKAATDETTAKSENKGPSTRAPDDDVNHSLSVQAAVKCTGEDVKPSAEEGGDFQEVVLPSPEPKADNDLAAVSRNVGFVNNEYVEKLVDGPSEAWEKLSRKVNYVSSEKLQEILRELSIETLSGSCQLSPRRQRRASHSIQREAISHPPEGFHNVCISVSPYIARRRRGHGYGRRNILPSSQYSRAVLPPPRCLIGARDRNNGANPLRDDTGDLRPDDKNLERYHPSVLMRDTELRGQENGGLWVTKLSEPPEPPRRLGHATHRSNTGTETLRPQTLCSESDSSSSEETFCYCHRPYCDMCSPPTCDSSDSCTTDTEAADHLHGWPSHHRNVRPVINFTEDLTPTFV
ncbi:probable G-protein coupled receptor 156 [Bufo gargarizans]|uniref:probable G-protein coupled receptor 156 n=1 Tax=Bufo gargarizans TaxID=30331 RepID=UPI001CF19214|nr:probable G-protein coupled receptor 156 [Bufo gargarizans]